MPQLKCYSLQGFCDASQRGYVVVVYLRVESEAGIYTQFLCSKTRVAPVKKLTIPRVELLSALLLARLVNTTKVLWSMRSTLETPYVTLIPRWHSVGF